MAEITLEAISQMMDEKLAQQNREVMVLIESEFTPKFNLLAEGLQELRGLLTPKSRIEELESKIAVLKMAISKMAKTLEGCKKPNNKVRAVPDIRCRLFFWPLAVITTTGAHH